MARTIQEIQTDLVEALLVEALENYQEQVFAELADARLADSETRVDDPGPLSDN